jgi:hypothetical protein
MARSDATIPEPYMFTTKKVGVMRSEPVTVKELFCSEPVRTLRGFNYSVPIVMRSPHSGEGKGEGPVAISQDASAVLTNDKSVSRM